MNLRRKFLALFAIASFALVGAGLIATPASAAGPIGGHDLFSIEHLTTGVFADIDYTCTNTEPTRMTLTMGWVGQLTLPAGMSYDSTSHHISGTPTETGTFTLPSMTCEITDLNGNVQGDAISAAGSIVVSDPPPPPLAPGPVVILDPLNNAGCQFAMTVQFPALPDSNTLTMQFSSGNSSVTVHGLAFSSQLNHWIVGPSDLAYIPTDYPEEFSSNVDRVGSNPACGEWMQVAIDYTVDGQRVETGGSKVMPTSADSSVSAYLWTDNSKCFVSLSYKLQDEALPVDGLFEPMFISISSLNNAGTFDLVVEESAPGDDGRFDIDLSTLGITFAQVDGRMMAPSSFSGRGTGSFTCDVPLQVEIKVSTQLGGDPWPVTDTFANPLLPCGKGTYNANGLGLQTEGVCADAPIGSYVDTVGSTTATTCPNGMTTMAKASASFYDCFKPTAPTIKRLKTPKVLKFAGVLSLKGKSDQGTDLNIQASGACTALPVQVGLVKTFKIKAAKKAGVCRLTLSAKPAGRLTGLKKVILVKVSKTGK